MVPWGCFANPIACGISAIKDSKKNNSSTDSSEDTNSSENNETTEGPGVVLETLLGENWEMYVRIIVGIIVGMILLKLRKMM